jgi:single-strand DNA-binding protein
MNTLNSILFEGEVTYLSPWSNCDHIKFDVMGKRFFKGSSSNDIQEEHITITVETNGKLAEACSKTLTLGRGIRVVGRLISKDGQIGIWAEHVEFKPPVPVPAKEETLEDDC